MNILPHKSWHVYNKKNIERVKRDEAKARVEEEAKAERAAQAESEARLNLLRQRAQSRQRQGSDSALVAAPVEHVNLFEKEAKEHAANEEYVAEQKAKDEKWERQITMYLDKGATKESMPWYAVNEYDRFGESSKSSSFKRKEDDKSNKRRRRDPIKLDQDPLTEIRSSLAKREEKRKEKHPERKERHHERKKHKKEKSSLSKKSSSKSIEALRAQRLEREQKERARTRSYVYGEVEDSKPPVESRYSAQFNPTETSEAQKSRRRPY